MSASPFQIRGVVEGFYGTFYTFPQRDDLIQFLGRHDFNYYVYGPKNDRQHRMRWFEPYPTSIMDDFGHTIEAAGAAGITFCYAISFGVPIRYTSVRDFGTVTRKLSGFLERGCRSFGVFLDDLTNGFVGEENLNAFRTAAEAQATLCNRLLDWLRQKDAGCALMVCPTDYWGRPPFSEYTIELGMRLAPDIEIMYTGPEVCSATITVADVDAFAAAVGRKPILWDNYPVNDAGMRREMHVGPLRGRDRRLAGAVRGYLSNPMNQEEASKIAFVTIAEYLRDPQHYRARTSWRAALREVGGEDGVEALSRFAENSLKSPLHSKGAPRMDGLVDAVVASLERGESVDGNRAVRLLSRYFDRIDQAGYQLKNRIHNLALRQDLLPWIEALEDRVWMGRAVLRVLTDVEQGADLTRPLQFLDVLIADVERSLRDIGGTRVRALAAVAQARAALALKMSGPEGVPCNDAPMTALGTA